MASSSTGLLLITQMRTILTNCVDTLIKKVSPMVERKLYVAFHVNVASKVGKSDGLAFDFIADVYRAASFICQPTLDVRILLENLKEDFLSKPVNKNLFNRIYRDVDCIFVDNGDAGEPGSISMADILGDIRKAGIESTPKMVNINLPECPPKTPRSTFVQSEGFQSTGSIGKYSGVVLGGTFDRIHNGHKILFSTAALLAKDLVTCGVTDGTMLQRKVLHELIAPVDERIQNVSKFIEDVDSTVKRNIVAITDPFGPSVVDNGLQCIVGSRETMKGVMKVNDEREKRGLQKLDPLICDLVDDEMKDMCGQEKKVSSSKMRQQMLGELLRAPTPNSRIDSIPYIIGLTGGVASGKSHLAKYLESLGAFLIDCDQLGHMAYSPGTPTYYKVIETFGKEIVDQSNEGRINRKVLGEKVFSDPNALRKLNEIVWPEIMRLAKELIKKANSEGFKVVVLDAAILFEAGWDKEVHEAWIAIIPPEEAIKRMQARNKLTEDQAKQRLQAQMSNKERVDRANVVFCSLWDYPVTRAQVKKAYDNLMNRLDDRSSKM